MAEDSEDEFVLPLVVSGYESDSLDYASSCKSLEQLDILRSSTPIAVRPPKKKAKVDCKVKQNELIENTSLLLSEIPESSPRNINSAAIYWVEKLKNLQPKQRIFAEKAINDILFEAQLGTLNRNSIQISKR